MSTLLERMEARSDRIENRLKCLEQGQDDERLRLLLVIEAEAGSEHADREAERLGLTLQLAVARERRTNGAGRDR